MDPVTTSNARFVEHVHCSNCGKRCSGVDPELGLVVRAWVECPECIERTERPRVEPKDLVLAERVASDPGVFAHAARLLEWWSDDASDDPDVVEIIAQSKEVARALARLLNDLPAPTSGAPPSPAAVDPHADSHTGNPTTRENAS